MSNCSRVIEVFVKAVFWPSALPRTQGRRDRGAPPPRNLEPGGKKSAEGRFSGGKTGRRPVFYRLTYLAKPLQITAQKATF